MGDTAKVIERAKAVSEDLYSEVVAEHATELGVQKNDCVPDDHDGFTGGEIMAALDVIGRSGTADEGGPYQGGAIIRVGRFLAFNGPEGMGWGAKDTEAEARAEFAQRVEADAGLDALLAQLLGDEPEPDELV